MRMARRIIHTALVFSSVVALGGAAEMPLSTDTPQATATPTATLQEDGITSGPITGTVQSVDTTERVIRVNDARGITRSYSLSENTTVTKDGKTSDLSSLRTGDSVTL